MVRINKFGIESSIVLDLRNRANKTKQVSQELVLRSREMQMVPAYLELAEYKGRDRFNTDEITELTTMIAEYNSEIPPTDLLKQLLNIGVEKGEPLSIKEIKDFFMATPRLDKIGQTRVLEFMKGLKAQEPLKYNSEYIKNNSSFEKFKNEDVKSYPDIYEGMTEEELKKRYLQRLNEEIKFSQYKAYADKFDVETPNTSNFINMDNLKFVYGVAKCEKPTILAEIALRTGVKHTVSEIPNELVQVYELCKGKIGLVQDLVRCFMPDEIVQISSKLVEQRGSKDLSKYYQWSAPSDNYVLPKYDSRLLCLRQNILQSLDLTKKIKLCHLKRSESVTRYLDGDFERGKRQ